MRFTRPGADASTSGGRPNSSWKRGGWTGIVALCARDTRLVRPHLAVALVVSLGLRPLRGRIDLLDGELRRPVRVQQPVGFLVCVRELRVAEAGEEIDRANGVHEGG